MKRPGSPTSSWRKSTYSEIGNCVEVGQVPSAVLWRKSSRSGHSGGECVEVAGIAPVIAVRDSKDPEGPRLAFSAAEWEAFAQRLKNSELDLA